MYGEWLNNPAQNSVKPVCKKTQSQKSPERERHRRREG